MNKAYSAEIQRLGGDYADTVWYWFLCNGPHGRDFTWSQTRQKPAGYVGIEHLQRVVAERAEIDSSFVSRAIAVVQSALSSHEPDILRNAIQVAAVVGSEDEMKRIAALTQHENDLVAADARASLFFLRSRLRSDGT